MRSTVVLTCLVCSLAVCLGATPQDPTKKSGQAKQGSRGGAEKAHTVTGCLQKGTEPQTFVLQNTDEKGPKMISIVETKEDLQGYLGLKIEITGSTVTEKEVAAMKAKPSKADHYMRVTAAKLITTACP